MSPLALARQQARRLQHLVQVRAYMRRRWGDVLLRDRYFSPNLSLDSAVPDFARPPRVAYPWKSRRD
jgi:hypothetical protein